MILLYEIGSSGTHYFLKSADDITMGATRPIIHLCDDWDDVRNTILERERIGRAELGINKPVTPESIILSPSDGNVVKAYIYNKDDPANLGIHDDIFIMTCCHVLNSQLFGMCRQITDEMLLPNINPVDTLKDVGEDMLTRAGVEFRYRIVLEDSNTGNTYLVMYTGDPHNGDVQSKRLTNPEKGIRVYCEPNPCYSTLYDIHHDAENAHMLKLENMLDSMKEKLLKTQGQKGVMEGGCKNADNIPTT